MSDEKSKSALRKKKYVTLVLRLLIDQDGTIEGTLVDLDETTVGRFHQVETIPPLIHEWLKKLDLAQK